MPTDLGRNDPCHCGSGKKYKKCHLEKDEAAAGAKRQKEAERAQKLAEKNAEKDESAGKKKETPRGHENQGWAQKIASKAAFFRSPSSQRRSPPANKGG